MSDSFEITSIGDGDGADGIPFTVDLNGVRTKGVISRSVLASWASNGPTEPLLSIFIENGNRIKAAARLKIDAAPGVEFTLGSGDF